MPRKPKNPDGTRWDGLQPGDPPGRGGKTTLSAMERERIWLDFQVTCDMSETARHTGHPRSTVQSIVEAFAEDQGDTVSKVRAKCRARLAEMLVERAVAVLPLVTPEQLGSLKSSKGSEAARAVRDLVGSLGILQPSEDKVPPANITIVTGGWCQGQSDSTAQAISTEQVSSGADEKTGGAAGGMSDRPVKEKAT